MPGTLGRRLADLRWCDACDVGLAVFPECYPQGHGRDPGVMARRAVSLNGANVEAAPAMLESIRTPLGLGIVERRGAARYNTAIVNRQGRLLGRYAKARPNEPAFETGTDFPVFITGGRRSAINICNDANCPGTAPRASRRGARLLCDPLNNMPAPATAERWCGRGLANLKQRAVETGCRAASSDVVGSSGNSISNGLTCVARADGEILARVPEHEEDVAVFELD